MRNRARALPSTSCTMRTTTVAIAAAALLAVADVAAWAPHHRSAAGLRRPRPVQRVMITPPMASMMSDDIDGMEASDIKAELDTLGVSYEDDFDTVYLKKLLYKSRVWGGPEPADIDEVSSTLILNLLTPSLLTSPPHGLTPDPSPPRRWLRRWLRPPSRPGPDPGQEAQGLEGRGRSPCGGES